MPQGRVFTFGADEVENRLPAANFSSSGDLELALSALSNLLGQDRMKCRLEKLFSRRTGVSSDPLVILCNIRRWALEGLRDEDLLSKLEGRGPLVAPDPASYMESETAPAHRTKVSRSITAKQARCVLANAFIGNCIDVMESHKDMWNVGGLDFQEMLLSNCHDVGLSKMECLVIYFDVCGSLEGKDDDERVITFDLIRFITLSAEAFESSQVDCGNNAFVGERIALHTGTMESPLRKTSAFVNFANPNYGYGKFISSCTQEEILLVCCPELIVGMLFIGKMSDNEVVNVHGVRRFCQYSGYLESFQCKGPVPAIEEPPITTVLTLDACYRRHFSEAMLWRDMSKAYFSFLELTSNDQGGGRPIVSTGKWGCGAFGGVPAHKMLQQAVAAAAAGVDLEFSSFGSHEGCDKVIEALIETQPTVARVISLLQNCKNRRTFVGDAVQFLHEEKSRKMQGSSLTDAWEWV